MQAEREAAEQEAVALLKEENALKRRRLEQERREIETREQALQATSRLVRLNVGGKKFDTFRETFQAEPNSYFDRFLGDDASVLVPSVTDTDGRYVIDRDGELFSLLLRGLRGASLADLNAAQRTELLQEARYYGFDRLMHRLLDAYDPYQLSLKDLELRKEAQAALSGLDGGSGAETPRLIDVLAESLALAPENERRLADANAPLLFEDARAAPTAAFRRGIQPKTAQEFRARLDLFAGPLFDGLDLTNLCVAGGGVLRTLYLKHPNPQATEDELRALAARESMADIDVFVLCGDDAAAKAAMDRVYRHLWTRLKVKAAAAGISTHMLVARSKFAITFVCGYPQRNVQLVLRRYASVADVLYHFDVDCCQVAFHDGRVLATPAARRALATGVNCADPTRASRTYESRLSKYAGAFGMAVAVPGLQMNRVAEQFLSGAFTFQRGSLHRVAKLHKRTSGSANNPSGLGTAEIGPKLHGLPKLLVLSGLAWQRFDLRGESSAAAQRRNRKVQQEVFDDEEDVAQESVHQSSTSDEDRRCELVATILDPDGKVRWLDEDDAEEYDRGANAILAYRPGNAPLELHRELVNKLHQAETRLPPMVWDCVVVTQEGQLPPLPNVTDAARLNSTYFKEYLQKHLTQHIEFPATGESDPFSRIDDVDGWFGDVYARAADKD